MRRPGRKLEEKERSLEIRVPCQELTVKDDVGVMGGKPWKFRVNHTEIKGSSSASSATFVHRSLKVSAGAAPEPWKLFQERAGTRGLEWWGRVRRKRWEGEKYTWRKDVRGVRRAGYVPRGLGSCCSLSCGVTSSSLCVDDLEDGFSDVASSHLCFGTMISPKLLYSLLP